MALFTEARGQIQERVTQEKAAEPDRHEARKERFKNLFSRATGGLQRAFARVRTLPGSAVKAVSVGARVAPFAARAIGAEAGRDVAQATQAGAEAAGQGIQAGAQWAERQRAQFAENVYAGAESAYGRGVEACRTAQEGIHSAYEWGADRTNRAMDWVENRPEAIRGTFNRAWEGTVNRFRATRESVSSWLGTNVKEPVLNAARTARETVVEVHDTVILLGAEGLQNGLERMTENARERRGAAESARALYAELVNEFSSSATGIAPEMLGGSGE